MAEGDRTLALTSQQRGELQQLARSSQREEADRARGILLTVEGWQSTAIASVLMVRPETVRHWRTRFRRGGVSGLREQPRTGRPNRRGDKALAIAQELLAQPRTTVGPPWTLPRLVAEIKRRTGYAITPGYLSRMLRKKGGSPGAGPGTRSMVARTGRRSTTPGSTCRR